MSTTERPATMPDGRSIDWFDDVGVIAGPEGLRFVAAVNGDIWDANAWHQIGASFAIYRALRTERAAREAAEKRTKDLRDALGEICEIAFEGTGERGKRILAIIDRVDPIPTIPSTDALEPTP